MVWRMKTLEELPIKIDRERIAAFCRERGIRKLSLFGSVVREDFDPETSDVDVLVEFLPGRKPGYGYVHCREALEGMLGRRVDLVTGLGRRLGPLVKDDLSPIYEQA
jgi:predicted nucleotidyltransferase